MKNPIALLLLIVIMALAGLSFYIYQQQELPYHTFEISSNFKLERIDYFSNYQLYKNDSLISNQIELVGSNNEFAAFQKGNTVYYLNIFDESFAILDQSNFKTINQAHLNPIQLIKPWQFTNQLIDEDDQKFPFRISIFALIIAVVAFVVVVLKNKSNP